MLSVLRIIQVQHIVDTIADFTRADFIIVSGWSGFVTTPCYFVILTICYFRALWACL